MLSITEMVEKTVEQRKLIKLSMNIGHFNPSKANIYRDQTLATRLALKESIRNIPLREFLAKSGTTGIAGAAYLIPDKIHDMMIAYIQETDKVPVISAITVYDWIGEAYKPPIADDASYIPKEFKSGGALPHQEHAFEQAILTAVPFGIDINIGNDLVEDMEYDVIEAHIRQAAVAMGREATKRALIVLLTGTDGVGTLNAGASGDAGETKWMGATTTGIPEADELNLEDEFIADTIVTNGHSWGHSLRETLPVGSSYMPRLPGFRHRINDYDILIHTSEVDLTKSAKLVTIVFDRKNALLTGRKRWLQINKYANPIEDLAGAVVVGEQDSVTLYNDSICVISET